MLELSVSELPSELDPDDESEVNELSELESLHLPDLDECGRIVLDLRVKSAGTVERDTGHSRPRSSGANDTKAQGGGGEIQNEEATRLRNGLEEFVAAEGEPFGSLYASVLWGRLEPGTRLGYVAAIWQLLKYSRVHGWLSPREALEGLLLGIARNGYFEGPVKKLLSGVRMAEKACVMQSLVRGSDWIFAKSVEKLRQKKNSRRIQWSPSGILYEVAAGKGKFTWPEMECTGGIIVMQPIAHWRGMDSPPQWVGTSGLPRGKESPRIPGSGCGTVGREMVTLPR